MIGDYFAARPDEIDEELVELGREGRFEIVSAKTHPSVTTTATGAISLKVFMVLSQEQ